MTFVLLFSALNLILGLFICFDLFVASSCGTSPLPSGSFSSKRLDISRRNTSSQLDDRCQLHAEFSFGFGWKAAVESCFVCVFAHICTCVNTYLHV